MFQVTRFRTSLSSDYSQKWKLVFSKGVFCGIGWCKETDCTCAPVQPQFAEGHPCRFLRGVFWVWDLVGMCRRCVLCQKRRSPKPRVRGGTISSPLPPSSLKTRRCYSTNSNQPLPSESAPASHSKPDESEPRDGNQPFFQCRATDKHGANTSVFHGPSACGNGTDTSYGHCGVYNEDGPGAEREHCRINDPTSSQYRNPAVSIPVCKYN